MSIKELAELAKVSEAVVIETVMTDLRKSKKFLREQMEIAKQENEYLRVNVENYELNKRWQQIQIEITPHRVEKKKSGWSYVKKVLGK